jgi:hypothetical protein
VEENMRRLEQLLGGKEKVSQQRLLAGEGAE